MSTYIKGFNPIPSESCALHDIHIVVCYTCTKGYDGYDSSRSPTEHTSNLRRLISKAQEEKERGIMVGVSVDSCLGLCGSGGAVVVTNSVGEQSTQTKYVVNLGANSSYQILDCPVEDLIAKHLPKNSV